MGRLDAAAGAAGPAAAGVGHARFLHEKILELERERQQGIAHGRGPATEKVRQLLRLRAIGPSGAWVYVNEFFGWRQFRNGKEVGAPRG